ncbi:MAG: hypothetical protein U9R53_11050 [Chloroflexota bacterium]|nr:hypothetical protein [Chloroflexota bacterium]
MSDNDHPENGKKFRFKPQWILFIVVLGVIALSVLALLSPIAERSGILDSTLTPCPTNDAGTLTESINQTITPTLEQAPPTVEEIGNTNGIILWSTILVLILLVGTLRETLHRKGE